MKKTLLFTVIALLGMTQAVAEEYEYVPFVREGVKWVYYYVNEAHQYFPANPYLQTGKVYLTLEFKGDTVIDGKTYKAMHKYYGNAINKENDTIPIYLREEDKMVYGIVPDGRDYADCPIGNLCEGDRLFDAFRDGTEFILYDFQDPVTYWEEYFDSYEFISVDTIAIGKHHVKRYTNSFWWAERVYIIEGIGVDAPKYGYTLFPLRPIVGIMGVNFNFSHVIEDGQIIYEGYSYNQNDIMGIDEVVADQRPRQYDDYYYNLMGQPVGKDVPTTPGIYIHQGKKIVVR